MRDDMFDILTDRGRARRGNNLRRNRRQAKRDPEGAEQFRGMRMVHGMNWEDTGNDKWHYNALYRWIEKQVGRPYNDVNSEFAEFLKKKPKLRHRFEDVLKNHVGFGLYRKLIFSKNGTIHYMSSWGECYEIENNALYVDDEGIIRKYYNPRPRFTLSDAIRKVSYVDPKDPYTQYHEFNGTWAKIKLRNATEYEISKHDIGHPKDTTSTYRWKDDNWVQTTNPIIDKLNDHILYVANKFDIMLKPPQERQRYWACSFIFRTMRHGSYYEHMWGGDALIPVSMETLSRENIKKIKALIKKRDKK